MRFSARLVGATAALVLTCGGLTTPAQPASTEPALRRDGRWLVDRSGRIVLLHGVNAVWKRAPYVAPNTAEGFTAADADFLVANGLNVVRLGVLFVGVMPTPGVIDQRYLDASERIIRLLASRGIYVLIDFHQDLLTERFGGEGFPDWAVDSDGLSLPVSAGFPGNYFTPPVSHAFDNLYLNKNGVIDRYAEAWQAVARRFRGMPNLAGYDVLNEPWPGTLYPSCLNPFGCPLVDTQLLQPFQEKVLAAIRQVDPDTIVWFEPQATFPATNDWQGTQRAIGDPQLGFGWHDYCFTVVFTHSSGGTAGPECTEFLHPRTFDHAERAAQRIGAATMLTEWGASDDLLDVATVAQLADERLVPWIYWSYKEWHDPTTESQDSGGQGMFTNDADLRTLKPAKADLLIRPFARAVAGEPLAMSFDPTTHIFSFRYAPGTSTAPTEIFLPARHYPNGYSVAAVGARVVSAAGARVLKLVSTGGEIAVIVTPR